ncbi:hypothetical protein lerEdw1_002850 [Lerista edwardsae]|nr:hypothetical protein lerEdw1_002850 [Lerista edwardsae]
MEQFVAGLPLAFSRLPMFPFFDLAHYTASVMSLKEQQGEYLVFYCPHNLVYHFVAFLPIRLLVVGMKEVTRTWKIMGGVAHAHSRYKNAWIVMIVVGWARGAGGGLISNFEQLVRGVWRPETNELLNMSCSVKTSLVGAVLFTMQHTLCLPIEKHNLMFLFTVFIVFKAVTMRLLGFKGSPFALLENALGSLIFGLETASSNDCVAGGETGDSAKKKHAKKTE